MNGGEIPTAVCGGEPSVGGNRRPAVRVTVGYHGSYLFSLITRWGEPCYLGGGTRLATLFT
jgi:hypothetical protein